VRDYLQIRTKIRETPWLITDHGLGVVLGVFNEHIRGEVDHAELAVRLQNAGGHGSDNEPRKVLGNGVGVLPIYGPIFGKANMMTELSGATSLEAFRKDLSAMLADDSIGSIILDIDSPGGTSEMITETGDDIFAGRDIKPIYAISNNMMGSAAYWLGSQATALYTTPSGSVGSIGAYTVHEDQSAYDAKQGIKYTIISAGPYKTEGNPHEALSAEGAEYRQGLIDELYDEFLNVVARGRDTDVDTVKANFGGGRMVPAKRALEAGMADGIMEFDALVATASAGNQRIPARVPVAANTNAGSITTATFNKELGAYVIDTANAGLSSGYTSLEVAPEEHSEPGTGNPPQPRTDEEPNRAATQGWRRTNTEMERGADNAPKANGGNMDELMQLFGVETEEELFAAIRTMHSEQEALKSAVNQKSEQLRFKEQFPSLYEEHVVNVEKGLRADCNEFLASVGKITKPAGDSFVETGAGLSALASETIASAYMAFAKGEGSLELFTSAIKTVTQGGIVDYTEKGSAAAPETVEVDLTTPQGIAAGKQKFADLVASIQADDKLEYMAAISEAARREPELAQAWRMALPA